MGARPTKYTDPWGLVAHVVLLDQNNGPLLLNWAPTYSPDDANTVIVHGTPDGNLASNTGIATIYSAQKVANELENDSNYDPTLPIKLVACEAASSSAAQSLANATNNTVLAPTTDLTPPYSPLTNQIYPGQEPRVYGTGGPVTWTSILPAK